MNCFDHATRIVTISLMVPRTAAIAADGFAVRLALLYAGLFVAQGVQLPFFPAWLDATGLDPRAIGLVLATPNNGPVLVVPVIGRLADRWDAHTGAHNV